VKAIADLRERRPRNIEKPKPVIAIVARAAFDDIHRNGKRRTSRLRTEFVFFVRGKRLQSELMDLDEKIVGTLPSN